jgi:hypothetical protein
VADARDPLDAAHEILAGTICECGDTEGDHIIDPEKKEPEPCSECDCTKFRPVQFVVLTPDEAQRCAEALDSHVYWQLADEQYRNDGAVMAPGSDDADTAAAIEEAAALCERLLAATSVARAIERHRR